MYRGVTALTVVEHFYVFEQAGSCLVPSLVVAVHYELRLQGVEETFHRRIVPAISLTAHALADPVLSNELPVVGRCVG